MHNIVIHTPESMPRQNFLIVFDGGFHISHFLVVDNMVNEFELSGRDNLIKSLLLRMLLIARQEGPLIINPLHKRMHSVIKGPDSGREH